MAGDWIKMRVDLVDDPAVIGIASATGLDAYAVIGRLWKLWSWADQQLKTGDAPVTQMFVDRYVEFEGFAEAMQKAGWLKILSTGISFPNFDRHNGKSAKNRALTRNRMKRLRDVMNVTTSSPEKRREDISNKQLSMTEKSARSEPPKPLSKNLKTQLLPVATTPDGLSPSEFYKRTVSKTKPKDNGHDPAEIPEPLPKPAPPADDDETDAQLDHQAEALGMSRMQFETDQELQTRINARRALG